MPITLSDILHLAPKEDETGQLGFRALQRLHSQTGATRDPVQTFFKMTAPRLMSLMNRTNPDQFKQPTIRPNILQRSPVIAGPDEMQALEGDFTKKAGVFAQTARDIETFEGGIQEEQRAFEAGEIQRPGTPGGLSVLESEPGAQTPGTQFASEIPGAAASQDVRGGLQQQFEHFSKVLDLSGQVFQGAPGEFQHLKEALRKAIQAQQSVSGTFSGMAAAGAESAGLTAFQATTQAALSPHLSAAGEFSARSGPAVFHRTLGNIFNPNPVPTFTKGTKRGSF